jgi:hypothetical protein
LTALETFGFPFGMIRKTRQILGVLMVAVALCASNLHGYSAGLEAMETHTHGSVGAHAHDADHAEDVSFEASQSGHDHQLVEACVGAGCEEPTSAHHCAFMHGHCCTSFALSAGECNLKLSYQSRTVEPERAAYLPLGQLSNRLYRPPRASA